MREHPTVLCPSATIAEKGVHGKLFLSPADVPTSLKEYRIPARVRSDRGEKHHHFGRPDRKYMLPSSSSEVPEHEVAVPVSSESSEKPVIEDAEVLDDCACSSSSDSETEPPAADIDLSQLRGVDANDGNTYFYGGRKLWRLCPGQKYIILTGSPSTDVEFTVEEVDNEQVLVLDVRVSLLVWGGGSADDLFAHILELPTAGYQYLYAQRLL